MKQNPRKVNIYCAIQRYFPLFMTPETTFPYSEKPATGLYHNSVHRHRTEFDCPRRRRFFSPLPHPASYSKGTGYFPRERQECSSSKRPHPLWDPSSILFNGYRDSFPWVKRPGREVNHSSPSRYSNTPICLHGLNT
jgi:hypothetical protein